MFKKLTKLDYQRTPKQAIGFCLVLLLITILGEIVINIFARDVWEAIRIIQYVKILTYVPLSLLILYKKRALKNVGYILLAVLSGLLVFFPVPFVELLPIAFLTTRKAKVDYAEKT